MHNQQGFDFARYEPKFKASVQATIDGSRAFGRPVALRSTRRRRVTIRGGNCRSATNNCFVVSHRGIDFPATIMRSLRDQNRFSVEPATLPSAPPARLLRATEPTSRGIASPTGETTGDRFCRSFLPVSLVASAIHYTCNDREPPREWFFGDLSGLSSDHEVLKAWLRCPKSFGTRGV